uniref:ABC-transporter extension domain-containing protein n=1 Tax=Oryza nivara TaxID=4536 RepID=A0A0E0HBJ8_ORYNI
MSKTHKANYSEYVLAKAIWVETQYATWEKQQEEIEQTKELINRLGAGVNAGRVSSEQKKLEPRQAALSLQTTATTNGWQQPRVTAMIGRRPDE